MNDILLTGIESYEPCQTVRVIQVIETTLKKKGSGKTDDPIRLLRQYYTLDGILLAEVDPYEKDK